MAGYTTDFSQWGADPSTRHDELLNLLSQTMANRQRAANMEAQRLHKENDAGERNWLKTGLQGASIGMMTGSPVGAAIGGLLGSGLGLMRATQSRQAEGQSGPTAFLRSLGDVQSFGRGENLTAALPLAAGYGMYKARAGLTPSPSTTSPTTAIGLSAPPTVNADNDMYRDQSLDWQYLPRSSIYSNYRG